MVTYTGVNISAMYYLIPGVKINRIYIYVIIYSFTFKYKTKHMHIINHTNH